MINQEDIDTFASYNDEDKIHHAYDKISRVTDNLAYEFNPDYLYNLLKLVTYFGIYLSDAQMMKIAYEAQKVYQTEH